MGATPLFSIVIATRDRPALFETALASVAGQSCTDTEIVVVNDGSTPENLLLYAEILARASRDLGPRLRPFELLRRPKGHGSSYALNVGVERARGDHVCFLDDDDVWIDAGHLARAAAILRSQREAGSPVDVYMSNQRAWRQGQPLPGDTWLEGLEARLQAKGLQAAADGAYRVGIPELLMVEGFCHLNCLMVRRAHFLAIGGLDEGIRWENDHDLYLRLLDASAVMLHHPAHTARHHVPDPQAGTSITTGMGLIERRLWQLRALDKTALFLKSPLLRDYGRRHKGHVLKRIAQALAEQRDWTGASFYALQALGALPTLKWAAYTAWTVARAVYGRARQSLRS